MAVSLKSIRTFVVTARSGSFTRAARALNISQGAVSQQVSRLEARLGVRLIDRSGRQFSLTNSGRRLLRLVGDSVDRVDRAVDDLRAGRRTEEVSITSLASFAAQWLVPRLPGFAERHPDIRWRIDTSPGLWDLESMNLDVGVRVGRGRWHGLRAELLFDDQLVCVGAPAFAGTLPNDDPTALLKLPLVYDLDEPNEWSRWFAAAGIDAEPALTSGYSDSLVMLSALRLGQGAGLMRASQVTPELESGALVRLYEAEVPAWGSTWLVAPSGREMSGAGRVFAGWLMQQAERYAAASGSP